jgi:hypothetical protein
LKKQKKEVKLRKRAFKVQIGANVKNEHQTMKQQTKRSDMNKIDGNDEIYMERTKIYAMSAYIRKLDVNNSQSS